MTDDVTVSCWRSSCFKFHTIQELHRMDLTCSRNRHQFQILLKLRFSRFYREPALIHAGETCEGISRGLSEIATDSSRLVPAEYNLNRA
ncbi:hypothetical protein chiPu_0018572 [Chiloscyllium punctatum]|uniref:Uncharacterized protein n=1 Tax=Chiloscyllium punctatum TaxID=137246 RepID=A0A401RNS7_CHIPU|nr:hypothetical protein [Chiloscyllium punctatum]